MLFGTYLNTEHTCKTFLPCLLFETLFTLNLFYLLLLWLGSEVLFKNDDEHSPDLLRNITEWD